MMILLKAMTTLVCYQWFLTFKTKCKNEFIKENLVNNLTFNYNCSVKLSCNKNMAQLRIYDNDFKRRNFRGKRAALPISPEEMKKHHNSTTQDLSKPPENTPNLSNEDKVEKIGGPTKVNTSANQQLNEPVNENKVSVSKQSQEIPNDEEKLNSAERTNSQEKTSEERPIEKGTCSINSLPLIETVTQGISSFSFNVRFE